MILVLGGSGYVGSEIVRRLANHGVPHCPLSRGDCDYYDAAQLGALIEQTSASFLINAAGFVGQPNVDACERQRTECLLGNAVLPGIIKQVCENASLPWGHVSTGCIFTEPAPRESGFQETDPPNFCFRHDNCSFYSGSKALGEELLGDAPQCYIWRLRMPFHHRDHPKNFLSKMIRYDRLVDARNSLTHLEDFARLCLECWERRLP
ncbi:MAG: sugar nucleotide-binding protein, partial [Planctomycetota bacterium]